MNIWKRLFRQSLNLSVVLRYLIIWQELKILSVYNEQRIPKYFYKNSEPPQWWCSASQLTLTIPSGVTPKDCSAYPFVSRHQVRINSPYSNSLCYDFWPWHGNYPAPIYPAMRNDCAKLRYGWVKQAHLNSAWKFVLHPLIHTLLEFDLVQDLVLC